MSSMERPSVLMLRSIRLFQSLPEEELKTLAESMWIAHFRRGEELAGRRCCLALSCRVRSQAAARLLRRIAGEMLTLAVAMISSP